MSGEDSVEDDFNLTEEDFDAIDAAGEPVTLVHVPSGGHRGVNEYWAWPSGTGRAASNQVWARVSVG